MVLATQVLKQVNVYMYMYVSVASTYRGFKMNMINNMVIQQVCLVI